MESSGTTDGTTNSKQSQTSAAQSQQNIGGSVASMQQNKQPEASGRPLQEAPSRPATTTPSAAAVQRALSAQRQPATSLDGVLEGTRDRLAANGSSSPSWPTSPRLKSPPPSTSRSSSRKDSPEHAQSNTAKRLAPVSAPELAAAMLFPDSGQDQSHPHVQSSSSVSSSTQHLRIPPRTQSTGLETVVEGSLPTTPSIDPKADPMHGLDATAINSEPKNGTSGNTISNSKDLENKNGASASRVTAVKVDNETKSRAPSTSRSVGNVNLAKRSLTSLTGSKKPVVEPLRTMTVETEPVNTNTAGLGDRNRDGGSIRTKTSTETIRPRKEKKKPVRKQGTLHVGGATSKADIFEAKVASAVDEADTSDSDETFVYESNPPDSRSHRHHSRTPSGTSLASTNDQYRSSKQDARSGSTAIPGKKSMKFGNSIHVRDYDDDSNRVSSRTTTPTQRHHHIGRHGRSNHPSIFDSESPFSQARQQTPPRNGTSNPRQSKPDSPRVGNGRVTTPRKYGGHAYDNNEDIADDERAPLIGTVRVSRNRHSKRPHSRDFRSMEFGEVEERRWWSRWNGCVLVAFILVVITCAVAAFVVAVNQPLFDVEIRHIQNVLASEQELMLDLDVKAVNPNLFAVTVTDLDVNLFAESPYAGTSFGWRREHSEPDLHSRLGFTKRRKRSWFWPEPPHPNDGVDEGTDPDDGGIPKILLGRVCEFDSPLIFDPTPMRRSAVSSVGEIRLQKPGNKTEVSGSERWERVSLHDFDLIVRGVIKYQLPLGGKIRSAKIGGRKTVHPDGEAKNRLGSLARLGP